MPRKPPKTDEMTWQLLESCLRNYFQFKALFEAEGIDELQLTKDVRINVHDMLEGIKELPPRQRQAVVEICLKGRREADVAKEMGFQKWSSPAGTYKRLGLEAIVKKYWTFEDITIIATNGNGKHQEPENQGARKQDMMS